MLNLGNSVGVKMFARSKPIHTTPLACAVVPRLLVLRLTITVKPLVLSLNAHCFNKDSADFLKYILHGLL